MEKTAKERLRGMGKQAFVLQVSCAALVALAMYESGNIVRSTYLLAFMILLICLFAAQLQVIIKQMEDRLSVLEEIAKASLPAPAEPASRRAVHESQPSA